jgi:NAD(P)H-dependent FMN reductase
VPSCPARRTGIFAGRPVAATNRGNGLQFRKEKVLPPRLNIIIASTRPARKGPAVAEWFHRFAGDHGKFDAHLVDIRDFNLPVYDEPKHPRLQDYQHDHTRKWAQSVAAADAYVFVTPEYNYFAAPALVNALDYVFGEWHYKPAGIVSYGGVSGGLRSAQTLKLILTALRMMPIPEGVPIPSFADRIEGEAFKPNDLITTGATTMLDELVRWADALKPMRG